MKGKCPVYPDWCESNHPEITSHVGAGTLCTPGFGGLPVWSRVIVGYSDIQHVTVSSLEGMVHFDSGTAVDMAAVLRALAELTPDEIRAFAESVEKSATIVRSIEIGRPPRRPSGPGPVRWLNEEKAELEPDAQGGMSQ